MRVLSDVVPTPEQLRIVSDSRAGVRIIRGAAGSGKTTSALLRLKALLGFYARRVQREESPRPVRALVLTYNKTLRGYIRELARAQKAQFPSHPIQLNVTTFGKWAKDLSGDNRTVITDRSREAVIARLGAGVPLANDFLVGEVDYLLGRFSPSDLDDYLDCERTGRGTSPRVERQVRNQILNEIVRPYKDYLRANGLIDWHDLAVGMQRLEPTLDYDIVIVDETQDFSANQLRAIIRHVHEDGSLTFILDTAQRIYARGFTWSGDVGVTIRSDQVYKLERNYRNTRQIAQFALPIIQGVPLDADGAMPDFSACDRDGPKPIVLVGKFSRQCRYIIDFIKRNVDLENQSVGILHPRGGDWFEETRRQLDANGLEYVELTRQEEWPTGPVNIGLSTLHSAKGLEFDHVIMIGLNAEVLSHGPEEQDDRLSTLRRLLAMGVGRAKRQVIIGYKDEDRSPLIDYFAPGTFDEVRV